MDPTQTLAELLQALNEKRINDALEHMSNLHEWLRDGGFAPIVEDALIRSGFQAVAPD